MAWKLKMGLVVGLLREMHNKEECMEMEMEMRKRVIMRRGRKEPRYACVFGM